MGEEVKKLAVLCGNMMQFDVWAERNPDKAGARIRRGVYEKAFPVTREFHIVGRYISGVERIGTYYQLPNLFELEQMIRKAALCG